MLQQFSYAQRHDEIEAEGCPLIVLDHLGFVSELNEANQFMIRERMTSIPLRDACPPGIVSGTIMNAYRDAFVPVMEKRLPQTEFGDAGMVFATGRMREMAPVKEIDDSRIIDRSSHIILENIRTHFHKRIPQYSKNQINYGKDNQKKRNHQVAGGRTLEGT